MSKSETLGKLHLHKRTVTGLSWSTQDANLLATCAGILFIYVVIVSQRMDFHIFGILEILLNLQN